MVTSFADQEELIRQGGGPKAIQRQHAKNRLTARERIAKLLDPERGFFELGLWAGWGMYEEWGGAPSAGWLSSAAVDCFSCRVVGWSMRDGSRAQPGRRRARDGRRAPTTSTGRPNQRLSTETGAVQRLQPGGPPT